MSFYIVSFIIELPEFERRGGSKWQMDLRDIDAEAKYADIHNRGERELSVAEVMNKAVIVIDINSDIPATKMAVVMLEAFYTENGQLWHHSMRSCKSIVRKPDEVKAEEVLSSPLVTIEPEADIIKASEIMLKANIKGCQS